MPRLAAVLALLPLPVAAVEIRVRSPARCAIEAHRDGGGLRLSGHLRDDRGAPIVGAAWTLRSSEGHALRGVTDRAGAFGGLLAGASRGQARLEVAGDERFGGCVVRRAYDLSKRFARVTVSGPREVREGEAARFEAWTDARGGRLRASLWRGDRWRALVEGAPDARGRWGFEVDVDRAGWVGPATLRVELLADERHNGAAADHAVLLVRPTRLRLEADREVSPDDWVRVRGSLRTPAHPVRGALVSVRAGGELLATARTDERGRFTARVPARALGRGLHALVASFTPAWPGLLGAASRPVEVAVLAPSPFSGASALIAAGFAVVAIAAAVGLRRTPRRSSVAPPRPGPPAPPRAFARAWRRLVPSRFLEGGIWDAHARRPVAGARIAAGADETLSGPDGRFRLGPLEEGALRVEVQAAGYAPEERVARIPARDELWIEIWPWREKILRAYGDAAARVLAGPPLGARTPSELNVEAARLPPGAREAFGELTALVQEVCYSPRAAGPESWVEAERLIGRLSSFGTRTAR